MNDSPPESRRPHHCERCPGTRLPANAGLASGNSRARTGDSQPLPRNHTFGPKNPQEPPHSILIQLCCTCVSCGPKSHLRRFFRNCAGAAGILYCQTSRGGWLSARQLRALLCEQAPRQGLNRTSFPPHSACAGKKVAGWSTDASAAHPALLLTRSTRSSRSSQEAFSFKCLNRKPSATTASPWRLPALPPSCCRCP